MKSFSSCCNFYISLLSIIRNVSILLIFSLSAYGQYPAGSPVAINGKLSVIGTKLSNECGNPVQLKGMSTHGVQWFTSCYNSSSLDALSKDWKIDIFRIAMYVQENGYVTNPSKWKTWIDNMVDECGKRGIYCLIDWHVLTPGDPNANITEAREFWSYMSLKHKGKKHVIYEICNEPNGVDWARVKTYADDIIPRIRANDPNTVVIVGTPMWSQDVDLAANNKLNYSNIMYALHFYSGTHFDWLRNKANTAISKGLALFVTEFGTSMANGDGGPYLAEGDKWMTWMDNNNISWCNWSFADKAEVSAALNSGACGGNWNNTTQSGTWVKSKIAPKNFNCSGGSNNNTNKAPSVSIISPANNSLFNSPANITINANAADEDGTISKVEFYNGNTKLGEDASNPYSYSWNNVGNGTYTLTARATDNSGATKTSSGLIIIVANPNKAPTVSITSPANAATFISPASITINANASDQDGTVTKVEFFNGNTKLGEDATSPYTFVWNNVKSGNYTLSVKASDNAGATSTSTGIYIIVTNANKVPSASISSPGNNATYTSPANIIINATASDEDGSITKVEFYNGNTKIGEDNTSPYSYTWNNVNIGNYQITVKATDNMGASTTSSVINLMVSRLDGIIEESFFSTIKIYPNPAESYLLIESSESGSSEVLYELYNELGQKVWVENSGSSPIVNINCQVFPKGMYVLNIRKNNSEKHFKIAVQ